MRILAFESSAKTASAAVLQDGTILAESYLHTGLTHSRTLLLLAENILTSCGLAAADIQAAACAAGPGSFTGVRIGTAAAKGFSWGLNIPCFGVSTLLAMACRLSGLWQGIICSVMDARRSQVYNALFSCQNGQLTRQTEDRAIGLDVLQRDLAAQTQPVLLVGDGAELCFSAFSSLRLTLAPENMRFQRADGVALAAWDMAGKGQQGDAASLVPTYLRLSQAERERLARLAAEAEA